MKTLVVAALVSVLWPSTSLGQSPQDEAMRRLPHELRSHLDSQYPGWTFLPISASGISDCGAATKLHPALATGDFNGDGRTDVAVLIVHRRVATGLEFLSNGSGFRAHRLFSTPKRDQRPYAAALVVEPAGKRTSIGTIERVDTLTITACNDVATRYVFRNGRIRNETPRD